MQHSDWLNLSQIWSLKSHPVHTTPYGTGKTYVHPPPSLNIIWLVQRVQASTVATFTSSTTRVMGGRVYLLESFKKLSLCGRQWWWSHHSVPTFRKPLPIAKREPHPLRSAHAYNYSCVCKSQFCRSRTEFVNLNCVLPFKNRRRSETSTAIFER